jgi:hypothetical protein
VGEPGSIGWSSWVKKNEPVNTKFSKIGEDLSIGEEIAPPDDAGGVFCVHLFPFSPKLIFPVKSC